jgi:antigen flippase
VTATRLSDHRGPLPNRCRFETPNSLSTSLGPLKARRLPGISSTVPNIATLAPPVGSNTQHPLPAGTTTGSHTYGEIVKSSILIGGSSACNIAIGLLRTKALALLLGPAGFGLMGLYASLLNLTQAIAGMGIHSSGVRQIAVAAGSADTMRIARTATVLRRSSVVLGLLGACLLLVLSGPVSTLTFGNGDHADSVALLSVAVLLRTVSDGQGALLQGLRRISDVAKSGVVAGLLGALVSIALVYVFHDQGVVPSLIAIAGVSLLLSWLFSRKVTISTPTMSAAQVGQEAGALLKLGFAFMTSGVLIMGSAYMIRMMLVQQAGLSAAGLYHSAWAIGGLYVGFILQAMGADFYPRLTAVVENRGECNRLVNEQGQVSLLLAGPGIIATLTFAPLVTTLLYSSAFQEAVEILRWICLGTSIQVITWPIGFIVLAAGRQWTFFWAEVAYAVVYVSAAWVLIGSHGANGAGIAFFASYVFHGLMVYAIAHRLTGFRWSAPNRRLGLLLLALIGFTFSSAYVLPLRAVTALGVLATLLTAVYSIRALLHLLSAGRIPRLIHRPLAWMRLVVATKT